jgi:hypothetical protein
MTSPYRKSRLALLFILIINMQSFAAVPTLGGMQFWNDISVAGKYKIQKNVITGHCRVLENNYLRHHWGSEKFCRKKLTHLTPEFSSRQIFLIHGLGRSHHSMATLQKKFEIEGYLVHNLEYSSMLNKADTLGDRIENLIKEHPKSQNIIITHSFGGILLRKCDPSNPLNKAILLAAPNQGSSICEKLKSLHMNFLLGPSGSQLYSSSSLMKDLPIPHCPFITIAGNRPAKLSNWPLGVFFKENSDGIVCESRTRLHGSESHHQLDTSHTLIMNHQRVKEIIDQFFCPAKID